jgi:lipopolysaccharide export system permease protein
LAVTLPIIIVAFLISIVAVWINDVSVSWGKPGAERVIAESMEQIAYGMLRTRGSFQSERLSIIVKAVEGRRLIRPVIKIKPGDERDEYVVTAQAAELRRNSESHTLSIILDNPAIESQRFHGNVHGRFENVIELPSGRRDQQGERNPGDFAIHELADERERQTQVIANLEGLMAVDAAFKLVSGNWRGLADEQWVVRWDARTYARQRINRLQTEPWRRWANGFSCFCFVMAGIPLSIRMRHADLVTSFFTTFVPILLVYYPLMTFGADQAKDGNLPQYACWLGNLVIFLWGFWMLRRVMRY